MTPIFRWTGEYFGFIISDCLFDGSSMYAGWIDRDRAWRHDGHYLGEIVDEHYVLRNTMMTPPSPRIPRISPIPPIPPIPPINRIGRIPKIGWVDALDDL